MNLISFSLAEMFIGHGQLRLAGQEALNAKHSQPPTPQLIKVALDHLILLLYTVYNFLWRCIDTMQLKQKLRIMFKTPPQPPRLRHANFWFCPARGVIDEGVSTGETFRFMSGDQAEFWT
jgi:hypothetical protein